MHKKTNAALRGFTVVEVVVVIVVIGILASIAFVGYGAVQRNAGVASVKSDLANASKVMQLAYAKTKGASYPSVLPGEIKSSPGVKLTLVATGTASYSGLTDIQNAVLFRDTCQSLINEGISTGTNNGGGVERYITSCDVESAGVGQGLINIKGWNSYKFQPPITSTTVQQYYSANVSYDSYRPNKQSVFNTFATTLSSRFTSLGGTFPVTKFWDGDWANASNGGVMIQSLPAPTTSSNPQTYCVQANHLTYTDVQFYIANGNAPQSGTCPSS